MFNQKRTEGTKIARRQRDKGMGKGKKRNGEEMEGMGKGKWVG
jgi:hypothetical protein